MYIKKTMVRSVLYVDDNVKDFEKMREFLEQRDDFSLLNPNPIKDAEDLKMIVRKQTPNVVIFEHTLSSDKPDELIGENIHDYVPRFGCPPMISFSRHSLTELKKVYPRQVYYACKRFDELELILNYLASRKRVILIEDYYLHVANADWACRRAQCEFINVGLVDNYSDAMKHINEQDPDIVILDHSLSGTDHRYNDEGARIAHEIKDRGIEIISFTSHSWNLIKEMYPRDVKIYQAGKTEFGIWGCLGEILG